MDRKCHIARHTFVDRKADIIGGGHTWLTKKACLVSCASVCFV